MTNKALTAADLAALIGVHPATIRSRASRGESLPPILRRNPLMFDAGDAAKWAREHLAWLTIPQAASCMGISEAQVRQRMKSGKSPRATKRGRAWVFKSRDVAAFVKRSK